MKDGLDVPFGPIAVSRPVERGRHALRADDHEDPKRRPRQDIGQGAADRTRLRCADIDAVLVDAVTKAGWAHGERHLTAAGSEAVILASLGF